MFIAETRTFGSQTVFAHAEKAVLGTSENRSASAQIADSRFWFADLQTDFLPQTFSDLR